MTSQPISISVSKPSSSIKWRHSRRWHRWVSLHLLFDGVTAYVETGKWTSIKCGIFHYYFWKTWHTIFIKRFHIIWVSFLLIAIPNRNYGLENHDGRTDKSYSVICWHGDKYFITLRSCSNHFLVFLKIDNNNTLLWPCTFNAHGIFCNSSCVNEQKSYQGHI